MTPTAVFDCNVVLQAALNPRGPAARCMDAVTVGVVALVVSDAVRAEYQQTLDEPSLRRKFRRLTDAVAADLLDRIDRSAARIDPVPAVVALVRDPDDAVYLDLAVEAGAEYLVSRDNDLLDLMTGTDPDAVAFRAAHPRILILDPVAFLARVAPPAGP